ncbi:MAG TPA: TonB family protein [Rhodocyclaceae bacterium]|nr:TonB family protein [Rhodocyclaceae bacterium]
MNYATRHMNPSKHLAGLTIVVLLHVVIAYALLTGLARKVIEVVRAPIETRIIEEKKKIAEPDAPPPPPPKLAPPPPPFIPPPEVNIALPTVASANAITAVTTALPKAPPPVARHDGVRTAPVIDAARSCEKPEYPAASRRMEEEGTVVLRFLIDVDGRVLDSRIEKSSSYDRLDQAARVALSKCKFKAGTVDGKPEQSWANLKYTWRLE